MLKYFVLYFLFAEVLNEAKYANVINSKGTLKPLSVCCDIPELGDSKLAKECNKPSISGPCDDVQCIFEHFGFLTDQMTLNKEAYKSHLRQWSEKHAGWGDAIDRAIQDCVDRDLRQYLDKPCKAYDVFTCTGIAMLKVSSQSEGHQVDFENVPELCRNPPPLVENAPECCPMPPLFSDKDFNDCGFQYIGPASPQIAKIQLSPDGRRQLDCTKLECLWNKYNLLMSNKSIDVEASSAFMDNWAMKNPDFIITVNSAKNKCLSSTLSEDLPGGCRSHAFLSCMGNQIFVNCPIWNKGNNCKPLVEYMTTCSKYLK